MTLIGTFKLFKDIQNKYKLNDYEFDKYIDYCLRNNLCRKKFEESKTIGSDKKYFVGYSLTIKGKEILYIR